MYSFEGVPYVGGVWRSFVSRSSQGPKAPKSQGSTAATSASSGKTTTANANANASVGKDVNTNRATANTAGSTTNRASHYHVGPLGVAWRFAVGVLLTINFIIFWAIPIGGMGQLYKLALQPFLEPIYNVLNANSVIRGFASRYVYATKDGADFFVASVLCMTSILTCFGGLLAWQLRFGYLPWWLIAAYNCMWVGVGGRAMGTAYTMAHKEGHAPLLYRKPVRDFMGNLFENTLGILYGNVPHNFTTSHILIHHRLNGGIGDTFYLWDLDRTSLFDFMLYQHRILLHCSGLSSCKYFRMNGYKRQANMLSKGMLTYWLYAPLVLLLASRSPLFVFWTFLQPFFCMTFFLALINIGFHAFLELDSKNEPIDFICSTTIVDGEDDSFGEDDHMTHHNAPAVSHRDLKVFQDEQCQRKDWKDQHATVFKKLSIVELSILVLLSQWDRLADFFVDVSGKLTKKEIMELLERRSKVTQLSYADYLSILDTPLDGVKKVN